MRRNFFTLVLAAIAFGGAALATAPALACPMCAQANETEDKRPQAYQASILFMMSMPALIAAGFGIGFYRLSRKAIAQDTGFDDSADADGDFQSGAHRPDADL